MATSSVPSPTRSDGKVAEVQDKVNDAYLKGNGQSDGVQSYGRVVDLMLAWRRQGGSL